MEKSFIIIYEGKANILEENLRKNGIERYILLNNQLASIYVDANFKEAKLNDIEGIDWWERSKPMSSLIEITNNLNGGESVRTATGTDYIYKNPYITSSGKKSIIVIIDSGIDYLHPDFIKEDGTSKIVGMWNQESSKGNPPEGCLFGTEFTREDINKAIKEKDTSLVKDNIGTGTMAAGIASGRGKLNSLYEGVAIDSELLIVKLREYRDTYDNGKINYHVSDFLAGIKYAIDVFKREDKFMVINMTIGEKSRAFIEASMLDSFNELSKSGIVVVGGAGNEGNTDIHYEGNIKSKDEIEDIIIQVGNQENLDIVICTNGPDKIGAALISPSGEISYTIQYSPEHYLYKGKFNLENTFYEMKFIYPWLQSGNQELIINLKDIKPGIWTLRLVPEFIISGLYDIYLPNKNIISKDTRFIDPSSLATITLFAMVDNVITVGGYDDKTDSIWIGSSKGPIRQRSIKPDIVAPGVDIIGTYNNNLYNTATGTGVSSSITSGVIALIMEYIDKESSNSIKSLYTQILKTYLMLGATRSEIYTYPNISQGYGKLNLKETMIQIANNLE
ncbi:MAG: bile acid germinant receptor pseudoprotease CspC [Romboutsia sp.]|uniref:bile acid germinant receptor pseudoprotease CspC n=1 Tax=Romboutsia sp. TaxID=1965302 RepID=UPI003F3EBB80